MTAGRLLLRGWGLPLRWFLGRLLDEIPKIHFQSRCHAKSDFQGRTSESTVDVTHHLLRDARTLLHRVLGKPDPFTLLPEQLNDAGTQGLMNVTGRHWDTVRPGVLDSIRHIRCASTMFLRRLGSFAAPRSCQSTTGCPDIFELVDGDFAVIGTDITAFAGQLPSTAGCAPDERIVKIPRAILVGAKSDIPSAP